MVIDLSCARFERSALLLYEMNLAETEPHIKETNGVTKEHDKATETIIFPNRIDFPSRKIEKNDTLSLSLSSSSLIVNYGPPSGMETVSE